VFDWHKEVPWTNNGTEQVIGRMKMRSRTVRGYKSWQGMWAALCSWLGPVLLSKLLLGRGTSCLLPFPEIHPPLMLQTLSDSGIDFSHRNCYHYAIMLSGKFARKQSKGLFVKKPRNGGSVTSL
jgi:hypothetical protein